jgi:plastocyanin
MMKAIVLSLVIPVLCSSLPGCSKDRDQPEPVQAKPEAVQPSAGYQAAPVHQGGTINGRVVFKGKHVPAKLAVGKDQDVCGKSVADSSLIVGAQGQVKNAVVQIADIRQGKTAAVNEAVLDQLKCEFVPRVLAIPAGTTVKIRNSDGILHNIHTFSKENPAFNRAQPKYLKEISETFSKAEIIAVRCDVHGWMGGWIFVAPNPYNYLTAADGAFNLTGVPAGKYTLEVWHETLGKKSQQVEVKAGETSSVNFEFEGKK